MSSRLIGFGIVITVTCIAIATLSHWQTVNNQQDDSSDNQQFATLDENEQWREAFEKVDAYSSPKPKVVNTKPKPPVKKRIPKLTDKKLIAIVEDEPKSIVLINARGGAGKMQKFQLGDSWLKPWKLHEIHSDFVVWSNTDTQQKQQQYLFKQ